MEDYTQTVVKKRRIPVWLWVVGALLIGAGLLGSCVMGGMKLYQSLDKRGIASKALAEQVLFSQTVPDSSDPIWLPAVSERKGFDEETVKVSKLYAKFGAVIEVDEPSCSMNSYTGTEEENGTFATCSMSFQAEKSPGSVIVKWKRKDDEWKLYGFRANFSDMSALVEDDEDGAENAAPVD